MGVELHYTQKRALEKLGYTFEDFFAELERLTYEEKIPLCDICKMFPQVSDTFIRNFDGWIDFIHLSDEERNERVKETYNNPIKRKEIVNKISNSLYGQKRTEQQKEKMKLAAIKRGISDETKVKMKNSLRQVWDSKEWSEKQSRNMKNYFKSLSEEEKKEKCKHLIACRSNGKNVNTSIELKVESQLKEIGLRYVKQKKVHTKKRNFYVDFYIPSLKLVIECNGDYWHSLPNRIQRDKELKRFVEKTGHKIVFIWEHEIKDSWFWVGDYL